MRRVLAVAVRLVARHYHSTDTSLNRLDMVLGTHCTLFLELNTEAQP